MVGLMMYLVGPGRSNEHENQRLIAGDDTVLAIAAPGQRLTNDDALDIAHTLDTPHRVYGTRVMKAVKRRDPHTGKFVKVGERDAHVWHCSLSLKGGEDEPLTDEAWKLIAEEFVERMGFIDPDGAKSSRWVAIHHGLNLPKGENADRPGNDHIHIAVQMVTEDGSRAREHNDWHRAQEACREIERKYGLYVVEGREYGQTLPHEKRHERARAERENQPWVERAELRRRVRAAAAGATTEAEFVQRVFASGVIIRPRFAKGGTQQVTGYSVALPAPQGIDRDPIFFSPAKHLDKNLSLPKVRASLGVPKEGDPKAVAVWQEHHTSTKTPREGLRPTPPAEALRNRLKAGTLSVNELARVFAASSVAYEKEKPGDIARASDQIAALAVSPARAGYMARLMNRAASKNSIEGWRAFLIQAMRLSRVMARSHFAAEQRRTSATHMETTERIIEQRTLRAPETLKSTAKQPTAVGPRRELSERERIFGTRGNSIGTLRTDRPATTETNRTRERSRGSDRERE